MSLAITYDEIRRHVGRFLSYGRDASDWTANSDEEVDVDDIVAKGLRSFYWPLTADGKPHIWSFLQRRDTILLASGAEEAILPDDFSSMTADFTRATGQQLPLKRISEDQIRRLYGAQDRDKAPTHFAILAITPPGNSATQYKAIFHPRTTQDVTYSFRYAFAPPALTSGNSIPLGGAMHAETILEACLAAAEPTMEDAEGVHTKKFQERLTVSLAMDREVLP